MVKELRGRKNIDIFGNVIQVILRNEIPGNNGFFQVTRTKNGSQIKKNSISKINLACPNTNFFSLYYDPRHVDNP